MIIKLYGGLGNQMFQYATGRALSLKNGDVLKMDLSWFGSTGRNIKRPFKLDVFNVDIIKASEDEIKRIIPKNKLFKKIGLYNHSKYIKEKHFNFDPRILNLKGDVYLDGYWQSYKYFEDFENEIRKNFVLKNPMTESAKEIKNIIDCSENSVSLHIRRGDYVQNLKTNAFHGTCSLDYYKNAIEYVKDKIGDIKLFIFSDDIEWAKEQKLFSGAVFVSRPEIKDYEEMILMSKCSYNIIANSSFSWWGAWLNENKNKIVVAPKKWFNVPKDTSDLIPKKWIRI